MKIEMLIEEDFDFVKFPEGGIAFRVVGELDGKEVEASLVCEDTPVAFADALEAIVRTIRRTWKIEQKVFSQSRLMTVV